MSSGSIIRRAVLDRCEHPLLARLLRPHASYFSDAGVDLNALALADQDDRTLPRRIYAVLNDPNAPPPNAALTELLSTLDTLSNVPAELRRLDTERVLPRGTHGPEQLALVALLSAPELAARARGVAAREASNKLVEYAPKSPLPPVSFDAREVAKIREDLAAAFESIDHTRYCSVDVDVRSAYVDIEIEHGALPRTREIIDPELLKTAQTTDVTAQRSYARFHRKTGRIAVRAARETLKSLLLRSFGAALFGDGDLFHAAGLYDLAPFSDLESALSHDGIPGLVRVELRMLLVNGPEHWLEIGSNTTDIRKTALDQITLALTRAKPSAVKLFLFLEGVKKKRVKVEIAADGKHNSVDYPRNDPAVVPIIDCYLRARRILSEPEDSADTSEAAE